jgi:3-hydroxyisobutyrate dehydrogenase
MTRAGSMQVALIGSGGIGGPMAQCLTRCGVALTVCDIHEAALEPFCALGVRVTQRAADCATADFVIVMVATDAQVRTVLLGNGGLFDAIDAAAAPRVLIMSSVLPETVRDTATHLAKKNIALIDAPVSGGRIAALQGQLTIMVGGAETDLAAARPLLEILGNNIVHCGPLGSGEAAKIINNIVGVSNMFLMAEAMLLATELGIDVDHLAGIMEQSSGRNLATRDYSAHKALYRFNTQSPETLKALLDICRKDLALAQSLAASSKLSLPMLEAIKTSLDDTPKESIADCWRKLSR